MRVINAILSLILILFVAVQYNDPDFLYWMPVYAIPAGWTAFAAYRPARLRAPRAALPLGACIVLAAIGTVLHWPAEAGFWQREVWWESETAREGMGLMVVTLALLFAALTAALYRNRPLPPGSPHDPEERLAGN